MIKILALSLSILLVTACKGGGGADPIRSPVTPPTPVEPNPPPSVGLLTDQEIIAIRSELQLLVKTKNYEEYEALEKKQLAGALLFTASRNVRPMNWEILTDKEVEYLFSLYFNENLTLK